MNEKQKKRSEIERQYKWNVEDLHKDTESWQVDFDEITSKLESFEKFKGKLSEPKTLIECLKQRDEIFQMAGKMFVYATMKSHEDGTISQTQGMADRAEALLSKLSGAVSFIEPEILTTDEAVFLKEMETNKTLAVYKHEIENLFRLKGHVLSQAEEKLLAHASELAQGPETIYSMIHDADMTFGFVADDNGKRVELTQGKYISLMESRKQEVRKKTFNVYYDAFIKQRQTIAATYNASVKSDVFFARSRNYKSVVEAKLSAKNIPIEVYTNLIETVTEHLPLMHKYIKLRKQFLQVDDLHMYDLYTPIIKDADTQITYEDAKETVLKALAPLGTDYVAKVKEAYESGWIDVYENKGKRSGAYSWGAYGTHPFVLLNFDNKINDMFTIAHEIGHAMHSHNTWTTQPYAYGDYTIFVAEVASTVNECLLMDYLLKTTQDETLKKYLINYYLEQFRGTLFRQTMFAEFELKTHTMVESGEPLTVDSLNELYRALIIKYYGDGVIVDKKADIEWARIPHFYNSFYVYQYATGYSAAVALSRGLIDDNKKAAPKYKKFLKSGSSDYSINLLKKAGVDMSKPEPIKQALNTFAELLKQMEQYL